ncbi:MAG TPA: protease modulator HflC [Acetobacteraceae bacterium]|nr:protease modulator HflC [Acetobacteraceae bacterium]
MSRRAIVALSALVVIAIVAVSSLFTVQQTEQALVTQFGKPVRIIRTAGLHMKLPFIQSVIPFDKRLLDDKLPSEEVILGDQRRLIVDGFTRYRITDPLRYYQTVGPTEQGILDRLNAVVSSSMRRVLGGRSLLDVLSADRDRIMGQIRTDTEAEMKSFGITVVDVRIRRADLPAENTAAILHRMQSERQRVAALARARGAEAAQKIRANAERDRTVLLADASSAAAKLRGEGEAAAIKIYGDAFNQDTHFFKVWRTLQAYRDGFAAGNGRLVLTPDSSFLRYLRHAPSPGSTPTPGK